ncbi:MAG TPA: alpha-hydroxy acid oxidase [Rhodopila sp.]|uniref:alpha-hydroxy acid oxidase n=1 Tax=Rhodopila sp. TaxID=2480087 RepID=UPI002CFAC1D4|nr:alpha-hydroxy acid oxidase [Rhodopila sp.]HVY13996.1 alpha-hydroxy acid oxidase [Rhodopila sp.]
MAPQLAANLPASLARIFSLEDLESQARRRLPRRIFGFVEGGVETNAARNANRAAFAAWWFRPRVLVNTVDRDLSTRMLSKTWSAPFGIAPMGATSLMAFECERVLAEAAGEANIPFVLSGSSLMPLETIIKANPNAWFQAYIPGDRARIGPLVDRVASAGYGTLVVTVDVSVAGNRENNARNGFMLPLRPSLSLACDGITHPHWLFANLARTLLTRGMPHFENVDAVRGAPLIAAQAERSFGRRDALSWEDIGWIRDRWPGTLLLKGILDPQDALRAETIGADGIIVSNHGGRQLDGAMPSLAALPDVARSVGNLTVAMDSGVRRGTDVLKALALGAAFVFVGRPFLYAAAVAGKAGVRHAISLLSLEIDRNMAMLGCTGIDQVSPSLLVPAQTNGLSA